MYLNLSITFSDVFGSAFDFGEVFRSISTRDVFESLLQIDVHIHLVCYLVMLMNCNYCYCCVFGSVFCFGDVFESVFDTVDVFCNSIFTCDVFESRIQSDVNKQSYKQVANDLAPLDTAISLMLRGQGGTANA